MATSYDEVLKTVIERATANNLLIAMSDDTLKITRLSDPEAATYVGVGHSTLAHKRAEQAALPEDQRDIASVGSIPYIPGASIEYRLYDVVTFKLAQEPVSGVVRHRSEETKKKTAVTKETKAAERAKEKPIAVEKHRELRAAAANSTHRGFSAFMQSATGADTWPFSIQPDGRPLDLYSAILDGKLTGNAERLNLHEFADRLAVAASRAHSDNEADAIGLVTRQPP